MSTALFVHGTGTRDPHFSEMLAKVDAGLQGRVVVQPCYWGATEGSRLNCGGASIPSYDSTRSLEESWCALESVPEEDYDIVIWELLLKDPLFEVRMLTATTAPTGEISPGQAGQSLEFDRLAAWQTTIPANSELRQAIAAAALESVLSEASEMVGQSDLSLEAAYTCDKETFCFIASRAVVAYALLMADDRELAAPARTDPKLRDKLVTAFAQVLQGTQVDTLVSARGSLGNHLLKPLAGLARNAGASIATGRIRRRRGAIHDATTATAGDVLLYQARGAGIRLFINNCIAKSDGPVSLLAHSLGGIACVDLLIKERVPKVELLVTFGSQAPFFYEINALQSMDYSDLPPDERLPAHFPPWLNFYDLRDFLSYVAQPVFGNGRVTDVRVDNHLPFPDSHGGYFSNDEVWQRVRCALPRTTK